MTHTQIRASIKANFNFYFGTPFTDFYDGVLTAIFKRDMIDLAEFEEWLQIPDNMSMSEYITDKYGKNACKWFYETFIDID